MKNKFDVKGMSCAACVAHVDKAVRGVPGVEDCQVNLLTNSMEVSYTDPSVVEKINMAVSKAGYKSKLSDKNYSSSKDDASELRNKAIGLITSIILLISLFYLSMGYMMDWNIGYFKTHHMVLGILLMLISLTMMIINRKFFIVGFKGVLHRQFNMDTLVALGSGVAFLYSVVILFVMAHYSDVNSMDKVMKYSMNLAFETAGMVPTLISIGKVLESYSKGKTTSALNALIKMTPKTAHKIVDGQMVDVDIKELVVGDLFVVKPGEAIPVDGVVIDGSTSINESALTGESMPIEKGIDSKVYTATINLDGSITCKALVVGLDTSFAKIIKMVEDAGASKAPIARIADKVAGMFVPIVMIISLLVFAIWMIFGKGFVESHLPNDIHLVYSIERAIAVLVVSCPCALGLATPVAIMVGNGKAARNGILFKNAIALEVASHTEFVVLDKTGTITKGVPEVYNVIPFDIEKEELLKLAASIESKSSHPLAKAVAKEYDGVLYDVSDFKNEPGAGIYGLINNKKIYGLSEKAAQKIIDIPNDILNKGIDEADNGRTPLYFIYDNKLIGIISVADKIASDSIAAIKAFKGLGITPIMLTGDNKRVAKAIALEAGIDKYISDVLPDEKLEVIERLKNYGKVMMVGDGINDAPALTKADIGVAIGAGSDVAIDAADIVLVKSSLMDAVKTIRMSRQTLLNIKENLFWAFFYNIIMIPIAAGAFSALGLYKMKPWYGAMTMALSSVFVVCNALRLNMFNLDKESHKKSSLNISLDEIFKNDKEGGDYMNNVVIKVNGMMCNMCKAHVEKACMSVDGVEKAEASVENKNVVLSCKDNADLSKVKENIKEAGYEVVE